MAEKICVFDEVNLVSYGTGIVKFIGTVLNKGDTIYYGIELKDKKGKNNGIISDRKYFECKPKHGLFLKREKLRLKSKHQKSESKRFSINDEVEIQSKKCLGKIKFIGITSFSTQLLFGVELKKGIGKHNGTKNKITYFKTKSSYGFFAKEKDLVLKSKKISKKSSSNLNVQSKSLSKTSPVSSKSSLSEKDSKSKKTPKKSASNPKVRSKPLSTSPVSSKSSLSEKKLKKDEKTPNKKKTIKTKEKPKKSKDILISKTPKEKKTKVTKEKRIEPVLEDDNIPKRVTNSIKKSRSDNDIEELVIVKDDETEPDLANSSSLSITRRLLNRIKMKKENDSKDDLIILDDEKSFESPKLNPKGSKSRGSVAVISSKKKKKLLNRFQKDEDVIVSPEELLPDDIDEGDELVIEPLDLENSGINEEMEIKRNTKKSLEGLSREKKLSLGVGLSLLQDEYAMLVNGEKICIKDLVKLRNGKEGYVKFIGKVKGKKRFQFGIELVDSSGKNDGCLKSDKKRQYFLCDKKNCGIFVSLDDIEDVIDAENENEDEQITYGDRIYVYNEKWNNLPCLGFVKFIGMTQWEDVVDKDEIWFGVELDDPKGNNNGSVEDIEYFQCGHGYGIFVQQDDIELVIENENANEYLDAPKESRGSLRIEEEEVVKKEGSPTPTKESDNEDDSYLHVQNNSKKRGSREENKLKPESEDEKVIEPTPIGDSLNDDESDIFIKYLNEAKTRLNSSNYDEKEFEDWENSNKNIEARLRAYSTLNGTEDVDSEGDIDDDPYDDSIDIFFASKLGYFKRVRKIIQDGFDINTADLSGKTPLIHAALQGHVNVVKELCQAGADVNFVKNEGDTSALGYAVSMKKIKCVEELLKHKANVNVKDGLLGWTPLHDAAKKDFIDIAKLLISYKADVFAVDKYGKTPYDRALDEKHDNMCNLLKDAMDGNLIENITFTNPEEVEFNTLRKQSFDEEDINNDSTPGSPLLVSIDNNENVEIKNISNYNKVSNFDGLQTRTKTNSSIALTKAQMKQLVESGVVTNFKGFDEGSNQLNLSKLSEKDLNNILNEKIVTKLLKGNKNKAGILESTKKLKNKIVDMKNERKKMKDIKKLKEQQYKEALDATNKGKKKKKIDSNLQNSKEAKLKAKKLFESMEKNISSPVVKRSKNNTINSKNGKDSKNIKVKKNKK